VPLSNVENIFRILGFESKLCLEKSFNIQSTASSPAKWENILTPLDCGEG
jgi:hypothetical protein